MELALSIGRLSDKNSTMAYLPCVLVCSFYILVNMNNINILASVPL
jgi:hypothetical protein